MGAKHVGMFCTHAKLNFQIFCEYLRKTNCTNNLPFPTPGPTRHALVPRLCQRYALSLYWRSAVAGQHQLAYGRLSWQKVQIKNGIENQVNFLNEIPLVDSPPSTLLYRVETAEKHSRGPLERFEPWMRKGSQKHTFYLTASILLRAEMTKLG